MDFQLHILHSLSSNLTAQETLETLHLNQVNQCHRWAFIAWWFCKSILWLAQSKLMLTLGVWLVAFHSLNLGFLCQVADNSVKCFPSRFTRELLFECSDHNKTAVHEPVILEKIVSAQLVSSEGTFEFLVFYIVFNQYYSVIFIQVTSCTMALGVPNTTIPCKILANTKILH